MHYTDFTGGVKTLRGNIRKEDYEKRLSSQNTMLLTNAFFFSYYSQSFQSLTE